MARNCKHHSTAVRFASAVKVLILCSFLVSAGVGYVWQKDQLVDLGRRRAMREGQLRKLREQAQQIQRNLMALQSPGALELKVRDLKLGLGRVEPDKIVRLLEPTASSLASGLAAAPATDVSGGPGPRRGGWVER